MQYLIPIIIIITGACFGSFITAASWRLPRGEDLVKAHSRCPKCGNKLRPIAMFPILSWIFMRGRCLSCKDKISIRYPLTELFTALIFLGLYDKFGLNADFIIFASLAVAMLILIISDFETYIMPDSTTIAALLLGLVYHYMHHSQWPDYVLGFVTCLTIALVLKYGFLWIMKRDALGWGDIKFLPVAGLWIGFAALPIYFIISGVTGILTGLVWRIVFKNPEYPFGPALAVALFILVIFPEINLQLLGVF